MTIIANAKVKHNQYENIIPVASSWYINDISTFQVTLSDLSPWRGQPQTLKTTQRAILELTAFFPVLGEQNAREHESNDWYPFQ